uniref:Uncharacterized protein n=1 Tax=Panagrolaimus sp. PS1159 TaxID=55785 RepID=A0AC35G401_9BILA
MEANDDTFTRLFIGGVDMDDDFNSEEENEELSQRLSGANGYLSDEASEVLTENDGLLKSVEFFPKYNNVLSLIDKADNICKQVQTLMECLEALKDDSTLISLSQKLENDKVQITVTSKIPLDLGKPTLLLVSSNQHGISTFTTPISFSKTSRRSIHFTQPPNYQNLESAYLIFSFNLNKNQYSLAKEVYEECKTYVYDVEMDQSPAIESSSSNDNYKKNESNHKTENCPSYLVGDFEGENLKLADIFNENGDSTSNNGDFDNAASSESEDEIGEFKQVITYKLKIHVN